MNNNINNNDEYVVVEYTEESKKRMHRKSLKILTAAGITLVVLIVATYAWFVGITTVFVSEFDVDIETLKGLEISFDGSNWHNGPDDVAQINKTNHNTFGISNNRWVDDKGLSPISSPGVFSNTGHLKFFSNASMESVTGGYHIRTEAIDNENIAQGDTSPEKGQYITFDMFLKNTTNTEILNAGGTYTVENGEAVYLTAESDVVTKKKPAEGSTAMEEDTEDTDGLENSVRIGFYQVAYVNLTDQYTESDLKALSCSSTNSLCSYSGATTGRGNAWNIWEPNDVNHKAKAINAFAKCKTRNSDGTYNSSTNCDAIVDGTTTLPTYAVNKVAQISDHVNIYDGLNNYTATSTGENNFLREVTNLKESTNGVDTQNPYNTSRDQIIRLLPNTITKVRVYVWLEGQDPDNLDYLGESKKLLIKFGFTKDMYEEEPTNRTNP